MKYNLIDDYIGRKMKERRLDLNLPLTTTAERFGMSKQRLRNYEEGTNSFPFDIFMKLCAYYGVSYEEIFDQACDYMRKETFKDVGKL